MATHLSKGWMNMPFHGSNFVNQGYFGQGNYFLIKRFVNRCLRSVSQSISGVNRNCSQLP
jgi:hypothetical protein